MEQHEQRPRTVRSAAVGALVQDRPAPHQRLVEQARQLDQRLLVEAQGHQVDVRPRIVEPAGRSPQLDQRRDAGYDVLRSGEPAVAEECHDDGNTRQVSRSSGRVTVSKKIERDPLAPTYPMPPRDAGIMPGSVVIVGALFTTCVTTVAAVLALRLPSPE